MLPRPGRLPARVRSSTSRTRGISAPTQIPGNTQTTAFICNIPRAAVDGAGVQPRRPSLYGHGLLGSPDEVNAGNVQDMSNEHDFVFCATRWSGMADEDIGNAIAILGNFALFPSLTDRLQQGFVAQLLPGPADDPPERLQRQPRLPGRGTRRDRHPPALLRRQQPGRDLRRRAHRALARLHPGRAGRARNELLGAAEPERGLRHLRADPRRPRIRTCSSGLWCSRWCRCSGIAATPTATPTTSRTTRCPARRRTRC